MADGFIIVLSFLLSGGLSFLFVRDDAISFAKGRGHLMRGLCLFQQRFPVFSLFRQDRELARNVLDSQPKWNEKNHRNSLIFYFLSGEIQDQGFQDDENSSRSFRITAVSSP
jgi:hypothetical protein